MAKITEEEIKNQNRAMLIVLFIIGGLIAGLVIALIFIR